jgi:hypothetical protein
MQTRAARPDRPGVDLRRLVAGFLRMAPDVAIVGEVRDREALPSQPRSPFRSIEARLDRPRAVAWCDVRIHGTMNGRRSRDPWRFTDPSLR